jgi:hypothetical protein
MRLLENSLAVLSIRDEGPFLLEWVAWYRMLGFENILVMHNDCTDHSPQLLARLERAGVLVQKRHVPPPGKPPQVAAYLMAVKQRIVKQAAWVFVADADEFLVVHAGDGSAAALAEEIEPLAMGMAINWRIFGSGGIETWEDGLVHRRFIRSGPETARQNSCYKTMFREPALFGRLRPHGPRFWSGPAWGEADRVFILADKTPFPDYDPNRSPLNATPRDRMTNALAQVNHYAVQTHEQFANKRGKPCAAVLSDRYTDNFFQRFDRNEQENTSALRYSADFDAAHTELAEIPGVLRLHHLCCADFVAAMCEKRGDDPKADPRYRRHREIALSLPKA